MIRRIDRVRRVGTLMLVLAATAGTAGAACGDSPNDKPVYLSFDSFPMAQASQLAEVLNRQNVKATFFVADGKALGDDWAPWWQARAAEGHAFGARPERGADSANYCAEIERSSARFHSVTGRAMPKIARPAAGRTPSALAVTAERCGWTLVSAAFDRRCARRAARRCSARTCCEARAADRRPESARHVLRDAARAPGVSRAVLVVSACIR